MCTQIWATGDPSTANAIMSEKVRNVDLLFEQETNGREEFKSMIRNVFKVGRVSDCCVSSMLLHQACYCLCQPALRMSYFAVPAVISGLRMIFCMFNV